MSKGLSQLRQNGFTLGLVLFLKNDADASFDLDPLPPSLMMHLGIKFLTTAVPRTRSNLFDPQTLSARNSVHKGPFLTKPVPLDSPASWLSFGTGFVKNGPL